MPTFWPHIISELGGVDGDNPVSGGAPVEAIQKWPIAKITRVTFLYRNISPMWSADHSSSIMEETEEERICAKVISSIMAKVEMEEKISICKCENILPFDVEFFLPF